MSINSTPCRRPSPYDAEGLPDHLGDHDRLLDARELARTFGGFRGVYRDDPTDQNAEKLPVPPDCHRGRSRDFAMTCFGACLRRAFGVTGLPAAKCFGAVEASGDNLAEPGSGIASLVTGPGRPSGRGHMKLSARPGGAGIDAPLTSTRLVIESVKGGLDGSSPSSLSEAESMAVSATTGPASGGAEAVGGTAGACVCDASRSGPAVEARPSIIRPISRST